MSLARTVTRLLTGMTPEKVRAMTQGERDALSGQLLRVYRIIEGDRIVDDARKATTPRSGVLEELRDGRGRG